MSNLEDVYGEYRKAGGKLTKELYLKRVSAAREKLIAIAKRESTITYSDLIKDLGTGRAHIGAIMYAVSLAEHRDGGPLLSAVVVSKATGHPSGGYLGLPGIPEEGERSGDHQNPDYTEIEKKVWEDELAEVYRYWGTHEG